MNLVMYAACLNEIEKFQKLGITEIILSPRNLSQFGEIEFSQMKDCISYAHKLNICPIIEWDILMTEGETQNCIAEVNSYIQAGIKIFRVRDSGAVHYIKNNTRSEVDLIQGNANQNIEAIAFWTKYLGKRLRKIVLSKETTKDFMQNILREKHIDLEVCLLGKILLSHTPRKLITKYLNKNEGNLLVKSREGPPDSFQVVQNQHGTFYFHCKNFSLLHEILELERMEITSALADLRLISCENMDIDVINFFSTRDEKFLNEIIRKSDLQLTQGLFFSNNTDEIFDKLKNDNLKTKNEGFVGEIIDVKNGRYIGILLSGSEHIQKKSKLLIKTPDGKNKVANPSILKNAKWEDITSSHGERLVYINYHSGVTYRSLVFLKD